MLDRTISSSTTFVILFVIKYSFIRRDLQNLQTPQFLTDNNGKSIALIPAEEYKALLAIAEMYEDLEDIQAFKEAEGEETEPLDVFLKRVEKNRRENGIY